MLWRRNHACPLASLQPAPDTPAVLVIIWSTGHWNDAGEWFLVLILAPCFRTTRHLGLPDAEERLAKAELAFAISRAIKERGLTQREAAVLMGIDQPKVSHVLRGRLADFSTDRLMGFLTGLGRDVDIVVRPAPKSRTRGRIHVAA